MGTTVASPAATLTESGEDVSSHLGQLMTRTLTGPIFVLVSTHSDSWLHFVTQLESFQEQFHGLLKAYRSLPLYSSSPSTPPPIVSHAVAVHPPPPTDVLGTPAVKKSVVVVDMAEKDGTLATSPPTFGTPATTVSTAEGTPAASTPAAAVSTAVSAPAVGTQTSGTLVAAALTANGAPMAVATTYGPLAADAMLEDAPAVVDVPASSPPTIQVYSRRRPQKDPRSPVLEPESEIVGQPAAYAALQSCCRIHQ